MKKLSIFQQTPAMRSTQRGVSLINIAIILVVSALLTSAALLYYNRYTTKTRVQNEIQTITDLRANVVAYGARVGQFTATNSTLAALAGQNFFPAQNVSGTGANLAVTNQWGGALTVALGTLVNAGDSLVFTSAGIPNAACAEVAGSLDNVASVISINDKQTKAAGGVTTAADVTTNCSSNDQNKVTVTLAK